MDYNNLKKNIVNGFHCVYFKLKFSTFRIPYSIPDSTLIPLVITSVIFKIVKFSLNQKELFYLNYFITGL